jgi:quinol monooxygenase YgiN
VILSLIELKPIFGNREKVLELLRFSVDRLRTRQGCQGCGVYESADDRETILYLERWESQEEFHRHIRSNIYLGVLNAIDLADGPREISFYNLSDKKSMDLIAALRTSGVA